MRTGSKQAGPSIYLRYAPGPDPAANRRRISFLVPRQIRRAVDRNRLKRRMREIYRLNKRLFPAGCDYLLQLTQGAQTLGYHELEQLTRALVAHLPRNGTTD